MQQEDARIERSGRQRCQSRNVVFQQIQRIVSTTDRLWVFFRILLPFSSLRPHAPAPHWTTVCLRRLRTLKQHTNDVDATTAALTRRPYTHILKNGYDPGLRCQIKGLPRPNVEQKGLETSPQACLYLPSTHTGSHPHPTGSAPNEQASYSFGCHGVELFGGLLEVLHEVGHIVVVIPRAPVAPGEVARELLELVEVLLSQLVDDAREEVLQLCFVGRDRLCILGIGGKKSSQRQK